MGCFCEWQVRDEGSDAAQLGDCMFRVRVIYRLPVYECCTGEPVVAATDDTSSEAYRGYTHRLYCMCAVIPWLLSMFDPTLSWPTGLASLLMVANPMIGQWNHICGVSSGQSLTSRRRISVHLNS